MLNTSLTMNTKYLERRGNGGGGGSNSQHRRPCWLFLQSLGALLPQHQSPWFIWVPGCSINLLAIWGSLVTASIHKTQSWPARQTPRKGIPFQGRGQIQEDTLGFMKKQNLKRNNFFFPCAFTFFLSLETHFWYLKVQGPLCDHENESQMLKMTDKQ